MFKSRWDPGEHGRQNTFWKTNLIGPNVKQDLISWAGCGLLSASAQLCMWRRALQRVTGSFLRVAWHQMGSISKKQLRSLMRPSTEMLKRPCPPYTGLHQERVEAHRPWEGC